MPGMLIVDCARCGALKMTHDARSCTAYFDQGKRIFEYHLQCRTCYKSAMWQIEKAPNQAEPNELQKQETVLNGYVRIVGPARLRRAVASAPEHSPADLKLIFDEGAECISIGAWNAASAMFRKILDQISRRK